MGNFLFDVVRGKQNTMRPHCELTRMVSNILRLRAFDKNRSGGEPKEKDVSDVKKKRSETHHHHLEDTQR